MSAADTIAAVATPLGEAGLSVIRVSGANAVAIVDKIFRSRKIKTLHDVATHTCHLGKIVQSSSDQTIDQVVVTIFRAPQSYTGEDVVEISAHGNPFGCEQILQACLKEGARLAGPGEFTQRAFTNGKLDLTQAEAVAELIHARSAKTKTAALAQLEGSLARQVRELRDQLLPLIAHVEVGLDHSDEDHDFINRQRLIAGIENIRAAMDRILQSERIGKILRDGCRVTLVGRPNVGKSSLMNALLKEDRAIVTPVAGTTRDTLEETLQWDGMPVVLTDTAGLRDESSDPIERLGIDRSRAALKNSDIVLGLFDGSEPLTDEDRRVIQACAQQPHLWVVNKQDLDKNWDDASLSSQNGGAPIIRLSAKTGEGLDELMRSVKILALGQQASMTEATWLLNARHRHALERAREALSQATAAAQKNDFEECVALELRTALSAIGEIIGETATEDLLGQIFSQFCVGK